MSENASHTPQSARPPATDAAARFAVGIDVGGTSTKLGVFTLEGELLATHAFGSQDACEDLRRSGGCMRLGLRLQPLLDKAAVDPRAVAAVGLAVPGSVETQDSLKTCPNLDLDLKAYREALIRLFPHAVVHALNDASAAVLGDLWHGSLSKQKQRSAVFVTLGTGLGAGVVVEGVLVLGANGAAGEIGHLCVNQAESAPCSCGRRGCLEQYVSARGLVRMAQEASADQASCVRHQPAVQPAACEFSDARAVLEAARGGHPAALAAAARFADYLGYGLAQTACVLDPPVFVLGGGLSEAADVFLEGVRARYRACVMPACCDTPIVASVLGNACGIYGAAKAAIDMLARGGCSSAGERLPG